MIQLVASNTEETKRVRERYSEWEKRIKKQEKVFYITF
jgi:hypothetical protein